MRGRDPREVDQEMIYIGLDPGAVSGAWAAINHNAEFVACGDIQSVDGRINASQLFRTIKDCVSTFDSAMIAVESVGVMPGQGIASSGKFMRAAGAIEAIAELTRYPFFLVRPQVWKKHFGLIGLPKYASLDLAREIWTNAPLKLKKCHNMSDALLMAKWLKDTWD